jgi:hypothetical protein
VLLLEGNGDAPADALAERGGPKLDGFGSVFELIDFDASADSGDERNDVFLRCPIDSCVCSEDRFGRKGRERSHTNLPFRRGWPGSGESLIVVVVDGF